MVNLIGKNRNYEVDFMRVILAINIMFFHARFFWRMKSPPFSHGNYGVDFFFILSGLLMARSIAVGHVNDTFAFLKRKLVSFYPVFSASVLIAGVCYCVAKRLSLLGSLMSLVSTVFELLLVSSSGLTVLNLVNGAGWYLSAMLIAMAILHPVAVKARKWFFPVGSVLLATLCYGILWQNRGSITAGHAWTGFCTYRMIRAIAGISLGVFIFEMSDWTRRSIVVKNLGRNIFLTVKAVLVLAFTVILFNPQIAALRQMGKVAGFFCLLLFAAYLYLAFSGLAEMRFFRSGRFNWCGPASLYLYLNHVSVLHLLNKEYVRHCDLSPWTLFAIFLCGTLGACLACAALAALFRHLAQVIPPLIMERRKT